MPIINIPTKGSGAISENTSSSSGDNITTVSVGQINYVTEELTGQILPGITTFYTSNVFLKYTLEVYINGIRQSNDGDYIELVGLNGFSIITHGIDYSKVLNSKSCILVKYIKNSN